ncbi:hypothetical protein A8K90_004210, partial [Shigella sonnei]|nr:hypothetical protein [Shigella sonnei]
KKKYQQQEPESTKIVPPIEPLKISLTIYHNVALYAPLKRAQRDSDAKTAKRDAFHRANRKNASGTFSARCMTMHETEWRSVWARPLSLRLIFGSFLSVCVTFHARTHPSATTFNSPQNAHAFAITMIINIKPTKVG